LKREESSFPQISRAESAELNKDFNALHTPTPPDNNPIEEKKKRKKSRGNHAPTRTREQRNRTSAAELFFERAIFYGVCDLYTKLKAWSVAREDGREEVSFFC